MEISLSNTCYWGILIGDFFIREFCWRFVFVDLLLDIFSIRECLLENVGKLLLENVYWRFLLYWSLFYCVDTSHMEHAAGDCSHPVVGCNHNTASMVGIAMQRETCLNQKYEIIDELHRLPLLAPQDYSQPIAGCNHSIHDLRICSHATN